MVEATAIGSWWIVSKKIVNAIIPEKPRINNHFLFTPNRGKFLRLMINKLIVNETIERLRTSSCEGIFCKPEKSVCSLPIPKSLTKKFTTKKDNPDKTISRIPFFIRLQRNLKIQCK